MDSLNIPDLLFLLWAILGPIIIPSIGLLLAYFAFKKDKIFLYRTLSLVSLLTAVFSTLTTYSVLFGSVSKDPQGGLVLVFLPIWIPFIYVVAFAIALVAYLTVKNDFQIVKERYFDSHKAFTLKVAIGVLLVHLMLWLVYYVDRVNKNTL